MKKFVWKKDFGQGNLMSEDMFEKVRAFVSKRWLVFNRTLSEQTELQKLGIDGTDGLKFMKEFSDKFSVDMSEFEFNKYFNLPFNYYLLFARDKLPKVPITLRDLTDAAQNKKWSKNNLNLSLDKINMEDWPTLGVSNLQNSVKYFSDKLLFELYTTGAETQSSTEATMKLYDFFILLKEGAKGPIYDPKTYKYNKWVKIEPNVPPILHIPVPDPKLYFNVLKGKDVNIISKNDMVGHELEGFYVLDNEDNKLFFFLDHHGPYAPDFWLLEWEQKTPKKWWQYESYDKSF